MPLPTLPHPSTCEPHSICGLLFLTKIRFKEGNVGTDRYTKKCCHQDHPHQPTAGSPHGLILTYSGMNDVPNGRIKS